MSVEQVLFVNPADVNLADVKAMAAEHNATVIGSPYYPRGMVFLTTRDMLTIPGDTRGC